MLLTTYIETQLARLDSIKNSKPPGQQQLHAMQQQSSQPPQQQQPSSVGQRAQIEPPRARMDGDGRNVEAAIAAQVTARGNSDNFKDVNVGDLLA